MIVPLAYVNVAPVQHVAFQAKHVLLGLVNVEVAVVAQDKHLELTAMLQMTYVNVLQV